MKEVTQVYYFIKNVKLLYFSTWDPLKNNQHVILLYKTTIKNFQLIKCLKFVND